MPAKKDKKEIDPEALMKRRYHAKCRFRAIFRLVCANLYWLIESVDDYEGLDVKRRIQQAVRGKKKKELLKIDDKALLHKPAADRTDQERVYLYKIIGGLKCFKRYPNHVKRKLAAVAYFKYYEPGRTIVKQHQEAHALYFIVTGDVIVSQVVFDELIQQYVSVDIGEMTAGDMFGEISLLHNIPRTATVTTKTHCEFLILLKEDFKNVLQMSIQKQWDEVLTAMSYFSYFDALDEVSRREGCIVARMKSFKPNATVLGDGVGIANHVYFILEGRCQMIESMYVYVTTHLGKEFYTLHDPYVSRAGSEESMDTKYFKAYEKKFNEMGLIGTTEISTAVFEKSASVSIARKLKSEKSGVEFAARESDALVKSVSRQPTITATSGGAVKDSSILMKAASSRQATISAPFSGTTREGSLLPPRTASNRQTSGAIRPILSAREPIIDLDNSKLSLRLTERQDVRSRKQLRTYFMQICIFRPGSTFGFGENMRDRRIIALSPVSCMLIPKVWLLQKNHANIWSRIEHYLVKKIPTKKKLFQEFVSQQKWQRYKEQMVEDVLARSNMPNWTTVHDVPYSIRMEDMQDIVYAKLDH